MYRDEHLVSSDGPTGRATSNLAACLLIVFGLVLITAATFTPLLAIGSSTPSSQSAHALNTTTPSARSPQVASLAGQTSVDANTVALFHFDEQNASILQDSGPERFQATLRGNARITQDGLYGSALQVDGSGSYAEAGNFGDWNAAQGTIEVFVDFGANAESCTSSWNFAILSGGAGYGSGIDAFQLATLPGLAFGIRTNGQWQWVDSGINACRYLSSADHAAFALKDWGADAKWPYETWRFHHVAATWGPRGMEIWVDGVLHGVGNADPKAAIYPYPYMCNPQDQVGYPGHYNPSYPACRTPAATSYMPNYPIGDYTGGLPSFNSMLIGCNSGGSCFKGRIDEVRISSTQRTFSPDVIPSSTPAPTATPVTLGGELIVDSAASMLYHLSAATPAGPVDITYNAVTKKWDGVIGGNAAITTSGRFGLGLALDGALSGRLANPSALYVNTTSANLGGTGTFETWVNLSPGQPITVPVFLAGEKGDGLYVGAHSPSGNLALGIWNGDQWLWSEANTLASDLEGAWHHVAGTWGERGMEIWLDGKICSVAPFYGVFPVLSLYNGVGCDRKGNCLKGVVDEVRISKIQRTFTPLYNSASYSPVSSAKVRTASQFLYFPLIVGRSPRIPCGSN